MKIGAQPFGPDAQAEVGPAMPGIGTRGVPEAELVEDPFRDHDARIADAVDAAGERRRRIVRRYVVQEQYALAAVENLCAGVEHLQPLDWLPKGVTLTNNRGVHAPKAGEYGLMALLALNNALPRLIGHQRITGTGQLVK